MVLCVAVVLAFVFHGMNFTAFNNLNYYGTFRSRYLKSNISLIKIYTTCTKNCSAVGMIEMIAPDNSFREKTDQKYPVIKCRRYGRYGNESNLIFKNRNKKCLKEISLRHFREP